MGGAHPSTDARVLGLDASDLLAAKRVRRVSLALCNTVTTKASYAPTVAKSR